MTFQIMEKIYFYQLTTDTLALQSITWSDLDELLQEQNLQI